MKNVGGDRVDVAPLVGPNSDAHVFSPTPADAKTLGAAKVVFVNGLGLEGWMTRLVSGLRHQGQTVVVSTGIKPRQMEEEHRTASGDRPACLAVDRQCQDLRRQHPRRPEQGRSGRQERLRGQCQGLSRQARCARAGGEDDDRKDSADHRRIITTHDAFGYFGGAYGIEFISPEGVSTDAQPSAKDMAKIIAQIKRQKIPAVFMENITDPRLMQQIAKETGAKIGGTLYSDALSDVDGPAATYIDMMRNNIRELTKALTP